jgi:hypothetical protein
MGESETRVLREDSEGGPKESQRVTESGFFRFTIRHTERTWGQDIEALLTNHIKSLIKPGNKIKRFIYEWRKIISYLLGFFAVTSLIISSISALPPARYDKLEAERLIADQASAEEKMDFLILQVTSVKDAERDYGFFFMYFMYGAGILGFTIAAIIQYILSSKDKSYVLLTKPTFEARDHAHVHDRWRWVGFGTTFVLSIVSGVIATAIYPLISRTINFLMR